MTIFYDTSRALDNHLNTMVGKPPIAWENTPYDPTKGTLYIRPTNIPGDVSQVTLGESGEDRFIGIYQIDVFGEAGKGRKVVEQMADTIASHFKRGTDLTYNAHSLTVTAVQRRAGQQSEGWYQIPVEIVYRSTTAART